MIRDTGDRQREKWAMLCTFLAMLAAHAYRYMALGFTDDSVEIVQRTDRYWQIALGRWLQPVYWELRGDIVVPYLIGLLSCLFLGAAVCLIVRMLDLRSKSAIAMLCALLAGNATLTFSNATFISWSDVYMLAMLLAVAAVALWLRGGWYTALSPVLLCASLALYQSYFQVAVLLFLVVLCRRAAQKEDLRRLIGAGFLALGILLAGLLLYDASVSVVDWKTGIARATSYNGIGNVGGYALSDMPGLLAQTWSYPFRFFLKPDANNPAFTAMLYYGLIVFTAPALAALIFARRLDAPHAVFMLVMTALMPLGMNCVYFISKGLADELMVYSFYVFFAYPIWLAEQLEPAVKAERLRIVRGAMAAAVALIFLNNAVYANQQYVRRDLEFQSTLSVMTRVIDRAEQTEGYEPGVTPVALVGTMYDSPLAMERPGFERLYELSETMNRNLYATSSEEYYPDYFWRILGYPFNLLGNNDRSRVAEMDVVRGMPAFPAKDSVQMIDGTLVIKLGETVK